MILSDFFQQHPQAAIGFSGGVDSAYLAYCAKKYAQNMLAIYYKSEFQPKFEFEDAKRFCAQHEIPLKILHGSVLNDNTIIENPKNRCYYCKQRIFSAIQKEALAQGFSVLLDGTNVSDEADDRPGMLALKELHVLSPLRPLRADQTGHPHAIERSRTVYLGQTILCLPRYPYSYRYEDHR